MARRSEATEGFCFYQDHVYCPRHTSSLAGGACAHLCIMTPIMHDSLCADLQATILRRCHLQRCSAPCGAEMARADSVMPCR